MEIILKYRAENVEIYMQKELPERKNIRLKEYDYSKSGYYFVTICVKDRCNILGDVVDGIMRLTEYGEIVNDEINNIEAHYDNILTDKYIVMPNHIHLILRIVGAPLAAPAPPLAAPAPPLAAPAPPLAAPAPLPEQTGAASGAPTIGNIIRGYKSGVSKQIGFSLWQRSFYDHVIRDKDDYLRIWQYIDENPAKWAEDDYFMEARQK